MLKKIMIAMLLVLTVLTISADKTEGTGKYIWENCDFLFLIDDKTIFPNSEKTLAIFEMTCINKHSGKAHTGDYMLVKTYEGWVFEIPSINYSRKTVKSLEDYWWPPHGLKWLIRNGYLVEGE